MLDRPTLPIAEITQIAANSALARVSWGGRGAAPAGYIKGMAVMFAVALRKLAQGDPAATEMAKATSGDSSRDALAHYASEFARLGMRNDVSGPDTLRHLFVLMIGLGMRESSGRYCEGRDQSASNTSADTAEAGLFQMSWDANGASRQIPRLLDEYQANGVGGYREIFCEGVTPRRGELDNCGSGTGLQFQQMCKERPGFAVEAAAVGLRNLRKHWGPINRHEAELRPEADDMLRQVQRLMAAVPGDIVIPPEVPVVPVPVPAPLPVPVRDPLWVQQALNALGANPPLAEDGVSGPLTMAAVAAVPAGERPVPVRRRRCGNGRGDRAQVAGAGTAGPGSDSTSPDRHHRAARAAGDPDREAQGAAADDGPVVRRVAEPIGCARPSSCSARSCRPARPPRRSRSARSTARSGTRSANCSTARRPRSASSAR